MRYIIITILCLLSSFSAKAQEQEEPIDSTAIVTNSFWDNWYTQVGADMILLFPVRHAVKDVFPNGKSLGISAAVGKWFSPEFGGKLKVNWNNGIIRETHNLWYKPYGVAGGNHDEGGFVTFSGDMQLNLHNLLGTYRPDRKWNLIVGPRAGGWINVKEGKAGPTLGIGLTNTYRLSKKWQLFADANYTFVPSMNGVNSGTDHGGNSYAEFVVGVEMALSKHNTFHRVAEKTDRHYDKATVINSFWDNWFIQAGIGMSLQSPYGTNFANVFPNGNTLGINLGMGKWFTPEVGVRGGVNWQNSILINHHAWYLASKDDPHGELDKRGFYGLYADLFLNLHNMIAGYDANRKWNAIVFPRMGLATNFSSSYSECPMIGIGTEQTYAISDRMKLYADFAFQVMTSGFHDTKFKSPRHGISSNAYFDLNIGVQYDFGKNWWEKPGEKRSKTVSDTGHNWPRFIMNTGASVVVAYAGKTALKAMIKEERPDHSDNKSFPSGHASMAFAAARSLDKEFRQESIWIPIVGYAAATAVGVERVASDRHHWYDVVAGAAVGIGSAELTWWLSEKMFPQRKNRVAIGTSGRTADVAIGL